MELVRNQVRELRRAYDFKRLRAKLRGRRVPSKAEQQALSEAIEAVKRVAGMLPGQGASAEPRSET